jgi:DNA-binding beta-propeller fold protein YncE
VAVVYVNRDPFAELPSDPSVTVNYAGVFPAADEQPLDQPFGIAIRGRRVYVAESGTGSIRIFNLHGESRGRIVLPAAEESRAVPTAIALTDDGRIAVIDAITRNVSVFRARSDDSAEALFVLGEDDPATAPVRPMGVAFADGEFFVVDGGDPLVRVYDEDGRLVRALGEDLEQPIENPGGIAAVDGELLVSDTKSGQVAVLDGAEGGEVRRFPDVYVVPRTIASAGDGLVLTDVLGQAVYVTDARGARTHVIDSTTVPDWTPGLPEGVAWTPVKDRAYVTDNRSGHVWVFNVRM